MLVHLCGVYDKVRPGTDLPAANFADYHAALRNLTPIQIIYFLSGEQSVSVINQDALFLMQSPLPIIQSSPERTLALILRRQQCLFAIAAQ